MRKLFEEKTTTNNKDAGRIFLNKNRYLGSPSDGVAREPAKKPEIIIKAEQYTGSDIFSTVMWQGVGGG